jgi:hypothetical protein
MKKASFLGILFVQLFRHCQKRREPCGSLLSGGSPATDGICPQTFPPLPAIHYVKDLKKVLSF